MDAFVFQNPVKLIFGNGQTKEHLIKELKPFGNRVLLVYGGGSIKKNGIYDEVTDLLESGGFTVTELSGVEPNPRLSTVKRGVEACREHNIDVILAVGGGSVIDCTKAIAAGAYYDGDPWDLVTKKAVPERAIPFGTILTIAATGSEMNAGSVITNWETNEKHGWGSPHTFPAFSILEPKNTLTLPKDQTVYGVVDMMTHVLEQYFHPQTNTPLQEHMCEAVLKTVIQEAPGLVTDLENMEKRETVLYSGTIALNGMLQMGVRGDWASHNIEHAVSAVYDIPHAGGLAILFPQWLHYHKDQGSTKLKQLAERVWELDTSGKSDSEIAEASINALSSFWTSLGAPSRLADYDIGDDRLDEIADKTVVNGAFGNFNKLEKQDVLSILRASL